MDKKWTSFTSKATVDSRGPLVCLQSEGSGRKVSLATRSCRLTMPRECDGSSGPGRDLGTLWLQFWKEVKVNRRQSPKQRGKESHPDHGKPTGGSEICHRSQAQEDRYFPQSHKSKVQNQAKLTDWQKESVGVVTQREMGDTRQRRLQGTFWGILELFCTSCR